jgi:predicted ATPase
MLGRLLAGAGALERSAALTSEAVAGARRAGHLHSLANALAGGRTNGFLARDGGLLRGSARALAALAEAQGLPFYAARARTYAGWIAADEGRVEEGTRLLAECLASFRRAGVVLLTPHYGAMLSDARLLGGDADAALAHAEEALRVSARTGEAWFDAELRRRSGLALLRLNRPGDAARAEAEFRRALEIASAQSALLFELRAARDLARLLRGQGRAAEARDLLAPVYARFTEGFGFPDLVEARALLDELGAAPARPGGRSPDAGRPPAGPVRATGPAPGS